MYLKDLPGNNNKLKKSYHLLEDCKDCKEIVLEYTHLKIAYNLIIDFKTGYHCSDRVTS